MAYYVPSRTTLTHLTPTLTPLTHNHVTGLTHERNSTPYDVREPMLTLIVI